MNCPLLHETLANADSVRASRHAILWSGGACTRAELRATTLRIAARLKLSGIGGGQRVAVCLPKSVESVQAILGTLAAGATYVPVDAAAPAAHIRTIVADAEISLLLTTPAVHDRLLAEGPVDGPIAIVHASGSGHGWNKWLGDASAEPAPHVEPDQTAAILYTSGSTGRPKGVMLSHRNISSFVQWAIERFQLGPEDRFTSHAPFHFDLSTLDLFASLHAGASVFLLDEKTIRFPAAVAKVLETQRITVWYSVPRALRLLLDHGGLDRRDLSALRLVLFACEVFPVPSLGKLMQKVPHPRYVNLFGPTETNVCTYHALPGPPAEHEAAIPIGVPCEHVQVTLREEDGRLVQRGQVGEICVTGPPVLQGYWRQPQHTESVRLAGRPDSYRTGDFGQVLENGTIRFLGRRDHQVKIRGHRVELSEIESKLVTHPHVGQAAVVLVMPTSLNACLVAFVVSSPGKGLTTEELHEHCSKRLPDYAVPARFIVLDDLPTTSTGKLDRQRLDQMAQG